MARVVLAGAAVIAAVTAAAASASSPGSNGRIFYGSNSSGSYNIWSVGPDGTGTTQLTTQPDNNTGAQRPSVDGNGGKVVFQEFDDNYPNFNRLQIWIMNGDGTGQTQLTHTGNNYLNEEPAISPDGTRVAFEAADTSGGSSTGFDIWEMNADGSGLTQLTSTSEADVSPEFSPDGTKIVFVRQTPTNQIWLMNADGSNQHVLLDDPGQQDRGPSWSPDGSKIVYSNDTSGLSVMNADGTNPHPLHNASDGVIHAQDPTWSPEGTRIAFYFVPGGGGSEGIFTVPATGGANPQQVINLPTDFQSVYPSWAGGAPAVTRTLTVSIAGGGTGTVTSSPAGIDCPETCSAQFPEGTSVTLTATAGSVWVFTGWSGGGCSGIGTCQVTLSSDVAVTATFVPPIVPGPTPPNTKLGTPKISSKKRTATFTFRGVGTVTSFQCALARSHARLKFSSCVSPKRYRHLRPGHYTFEVRALNGTLRDTTPARKKFTIGTS